MEKDYRYLSPLVPTVGMQDGGLTRFRIAAGSKLGQNHFSLRHHLVTTEIAFDDEALKMREARRGSAADWEKGTGKRVKRGRNPCEKVKGGKGDATLCRPFVG